MFDQLGCLSASRWSQQQKESIYSLRVSQLSLPMQMYRKSNSRLRRLMLASKLWKSRKNSLSRQLRL